MEIIHNTFGIHHDSDEGEGCAYDNDDDGDAARELGAIGGPMNVVLVLVALMLNRRC